jgi:hypothetical protein
MISTEDFVQHDTCQCFHTYTARYEPLRVSLNYALNESISAAFEANNPAYASDKVMALAASPGIEIESKNLYPSVVHHNRLAELLATYLLSVGEVTTPAPITCKWGEYQPKSFLTPDGRLRRVILCDRWNTDREHLERMSWRTVADSAITNRPMLLNVLIIGGVRDGFRPSVWTKGYEHPENKTIRVQRREGLFGDTWKPVYREQTDLKPIEWLKIMQQDGAFEGRVFSFTVDVPSNRDEVLEQLALMASEMGSLRQTRSACYRFKPCTFLPSCLSGKSPNQMGWIEKT